jgi:redox-regulated HSP33 family molecular chaperone
MISMINKSISKQYTRFSRCNFGSLSTNSDLLITGLNGKNDVSIKVISCKNLVQDIINKNKYSDFSSKYMGESLACSLMMGAGFKNDETLQINLVGDKNLGNIMIITNAELQARATVRNSVYETNEIKDKYNLIDIIGEGQIQIVRSHPLWKQPITGIISIRSDLNIAHNLALYMTESDQRPAIFYTDVNVINNICEYALAIMIERLPGTDETSIDICMNNINKINSKRLNTYLYNNSLETNEIKEEYKELVSIEESLHKILDDSLIDMEGESIRWTKCRKFFSQ